MTTTTLGQWIDSLQGAEYAALVAVLWIGVIMLVVAGARK
jgi:predicted tellurium resistance membrane protein TerC